MHMLVQVVSHCSPVCIAVSELENISPVDNYTDHKF